MAKLDQVNYKGTIAEIVPEIAPLFKTTESYAAGDQVIYEADWYTFKEAKEAGAWDAMKVDGPFKVADEIVSLKEELGSTPVDKQPRFIIFKNEQVKSTTGEISEYTSRGRSDYIPTKGAKTFSITFSNTMLNWVFFDATKAYIIGYTSPVSETVYPIPNSAEYIMFCGTNTAVETAVITLYEVNTALSVKANLSSVFGVDFVSDKSLLQNVIGVNKFPNNLVVIGECVDTRIINTNAGVETLGGDNYFCTGYIPITAGTTYKANHGRNYAWYDSNKTYISGAIGTDIQNGITAPENATFIRFTINKTTDGIAYPFDLYFADVAEYDSEVTIPNLVVTNTKPWCYGKKINWIGDSIVDGPDFDEVVCDALGLVKASEYGINGSTIALKSDGTDGRNALCVRYVNMSDDADIIAVSCGTNDFEYAWCPIGTINDADDGTSNTTFYGALKTLCKGLIDKYPQKVIFFTTPIKRAQAFANGDGGEYTADGVMTTPFSKNKYGKTLMDYADIIKEVCGYYSIPVLDMNRESLLNPHLTSQQNMFDNVYTHPNATGQKIMARRIAGWITQLGYIIS